MSTNSGATAADFEHGDSSSSGKGDPARKQYAIDLGRRCRDARGSLKAADVAAELGVHRNTIWNIENGVKVPDAFELIQLARLYGTTVTALVFDEVAPTSPFDGAEKNLRAVERGNFVYVPHFDVPVSAGPGDEFEDIETVKAMRPFDSGYIRGELGIAHEDIVLVSIIGDSAEPRLSSKDTVMINLREREVFTEGLHLIRLDRALLIKKLQRLPGKVIRVKSENPAYEPFDIVASEDDERDFAILGRATWGGVTFR